MTEKKVLAVSPEGRSAPVAWEAEGEKERQAREKNAEKQKRFRDGKKAEGYRRVTLWDMPGPADKRMAGMGFRQTPSWETPGREERKKPGAIKVKVSSAIREKSIGAAARYPQVQKALERASDEFLSVLGEFPEGKGIYNDYLELVKVLGDPFGEG